MLHNRKRDTGSNPEVFYKTDLRMIPFRTPWVQASYLNSRRVTEDGPAYVLPHSGVFQLDNL